MTRQIKGIILCIISAIAFSLGGLLIKLIPWSGLSIGAGRCVFSSLLFAIFFIVKKKKVVFNKTTIIGAILVVLNMLTYIYANKLTTAANTIILEYTAPVYIILFGLIFRNKKPTKLQITTVVCVITGVIIVMIEGLSKGNMLGNIIAMINGVVYAGVIMLNDFKMSDSLSSMLMGHILYFVIGLPSLVNETNLSLDVIKLVCIMGIFQTGLGYLLFTLSTMYADSLTVSLVAYIEPILNPIIVAVFYNEPLTLASILGITLVLSSIFIYTLKSSK